MLSVIVGLAAAVMVPAQVVTIGFENVGENYALGPLSPQAGNAQNGWSGGAVPLFVNNDAGDEEITNAVAHSGSQSWRYSRGYGSPGSGTPFTPALPAGVTQDGDMFTASLWFRAVSTTADDSVIAIETGNAAGTDRGNYLAFLSNEAGGIRLYSFATPAFTVIELFSSVSTATWHQLEFTLTKDGFDDLVTVALDGGTPVQFVAALNTWRGSLPPEDPSAGYADSSRLKFRSTTDELAKQGFYFDDISYSVTAIPEAGTSTLLAGLAAVGLVLAWRKRRSAA